MITFVRITASQKNVSLSPPDESSFLTLEFSPTRAGFPLHESQGIYEAMA